MYTIIPTEKFKEDVEYYEKKKNFTNITNDINTVVQELKIGNLVGVPISRA